jgi:hypothetical protein
MKSLPFSRQLRVSEALQKDVTENEAVTERVEQDVRSKIDQVYSVAPLTGRGTAGNRLSMPAATDLVDGYMTAADHALLTALVGYGQPIESEVPGGAINGVNVTFTLAFVAKVGSVKLYQNGVRTTAFTVAGLTITMSVAPVAGETLLADYRK